MKLQDAIKKMMAMPIQEVAKSRISRISFNEYHFSLTIQDFETAEPTVEIYDRDSSERMFVNRLGGVLLDLKDLMAEDWEVMCDL